MVEIVSRESRVMDIISELKKKFKMFDHKSIVRDLERCIESFGIDVKYSDQQYNFRGYLKISKSKEYTVVLNGNHNLADMRYTMAYFLGYSIMYCKFLGRDNPGIVSDIYKSLTRVSPDMFNKTKAESYCDLFAKELLCPLDELIATLDGTNYHQMDVLEKVELEADTMHQFKVCDVVARTKLDETCVM